MLTQVDTGSLDIERLAALLGQREADRVREAAQRARTHLAGRAAIDVNPTARGGGVVESVADLVSAHHHGCRGHVLVHALLESVREDAERRTGQ